MENKPEDLTAESIEQIERTALNALVVAARDFAVDAWEFFRQSRDDPKDIAEDITREMLDRLGGYGIQQRIFGNVDYRKARYIILPELMVRQALMVDSKAEKAASSATLQLSQLSLAVRQMYRGQPIEMPGQLPDVQIYNGVSYITTTLLAHYHYTAQAGNDGKDRPPYRLLQLTLAAIPNGRLQDIYAPTYHDTIFARGRDAPTRGEKFRVRLSFSKLRLKAAWRVRRLQYDAHGNFSLR